LFQGE
jgi:hypothetical protein